MHTQPNKMLNLFSSKDQVMCTQRNMNRMNYVDIIQMLNYGISIEYNLFQMYLQISTSHVCTRDKC